MEHPYLEMNLNNRLNSISFKSTQEKNERHGQFVCSTPPNPITDVEISTVSHDSNPDLDHYAYLGYHITKKSLFKDFVLWFISSIKMIIAIFIALLFSPITIILTTCFLSPIFRLIRYHIFYFFLAILLPSWYITQKISILFGYEYMSNFHASAYCTIVPLVLSILYKDAIIYASRLKYNIEKVYSNNYKMLKMHCIPVCCLCCTEKYRAYTLACCAWKAENIFTDFIRNYRVWGPALDKYQPFGKEFRKFDYRTRTRSEINSDSEKIDFKKLYQTLTLENSFRRTMAWYSRLFCFCPTIYFIYQHMNVLIFTENIHVHILFVVDGVFALLGLIFLYFTSTAINSYIEIIFYRLCKYYAYMKAFADLIEIPPYRLAKEFENDCKYKNNKTMLLYKNNNCMIWLENWSRLEHLITNYFDSHKSIIFAILTSLAACIACLLYYALNKHTDMMNTMTISIFGWFIYVSIVISRLLIYSSKFSSLEQRQIHLIKTQQIFFSHSILDPKLIVNVHNGNDVMDDNDDNDDNDDDDDDYNDNEEKKEEFLNLNNMQCTENCRINNNIKLFYMNYIVQQIERQSVSPKIGGILLNKALIYSTRAFTVTLITSFITYVLKRI